MRRPETGDGSSAVTLSVMISTRDSSRLTVSPSFLSQRPIVPSETDSPSCGMVMVVGMGALLFMLARRCASSGGYTRATDVRCMRSYRARGHQACLRWLGGGCGRRVLELFASVVWVCSLGL